MYVETLLVLETSGQYLALNKSTIHHPDYGPRLFVAGTIEKWKDARYYYC